MAAKKKRSTTDSEKAKPPVVEAEIVDAEAEDGDGEIIAPDVGDAPEVIEGEFALDPDTAGEERTETAPINDSADAAYQVLDHALSLGLSTPSRGNEVIPYDPVQSYLSEIRHIPRLSREEEHALALRYFEKRDKAAAYKIIVSNLRLVVLIAREYQRNVQNLLDLVQEGNIGLLEAIEQFDPYKGVRFPSYAAYWIRAYMLRFIINNLRLVKIGTTQAQRKLFYNLQKEKDKLEAEGFVPEAKLLAERLQVKESEVLEMEQRLGLPDLSVDAPIGNREDSSDLHGLLPDRGPSVEDTVAASEFSHALREAVDKFKLSLDEKEKVIIDTRLFTEEPITLQEIADKFKLSRERIRQIEARLKTRLKTFLAQELQLGDGGNVDIEI